MKKILITVSAMLLAGSVFAADDSPLWLRKNCISPDGSKIAFCYQGDIYVVDSDGGKAVQVTSNPSYDSDPIWTPDGKGIVFSSYREGNKDIYMTSAEGGAPVRVTDYPGNETPMYVLPDGRVVFTANLMQDAEYDGFPGSSAQLYTVGREGGRPEYVTSLPVSGISVNKDNVVLYEDWKGYEDNFRKHHTSSVTRDIWVYRPSSGQTGFGIDGKGSFEKLSTFNGEDRNPVFAADGDTYYYLSEKSGSFNIYRSSLSNPSESVQITHNTTHPVRYISVAGNGTISFSYNGELYTVRDGQEPEKVNISIVSDKLERENIITYFSSGSNDLAVSPNGKEVAIILRGDVFVTSVDYNTTRRITDTPEQERNLSFSEDGRTLYYSSERDGHWGIYATSLSDKDDKYFTYSVKMEEKMVTDPGQTCFQPQVSPDGKWLAFLRDRTELVVKNIKSGKEKSLHKNVNYSYSDGDQSFAWSPDSKYLLCNWQADGGWNNEDIALIDVESGEITDLTESGYTDGNFRWALGGKAMTWMSDRAGYRSHGSWGAEYDVYAMFFDGKEFYKFTRDKESDEMETLLTDEKEAKKEEKQEAKDSAKVEKGAEKLVLDLDNRADRIVRLTRFSGRLGDHYMNADGSKLYYMTRLEKSYDLCVLDIKEGSINVLAKGLFGSIYPTKDDKSFYVLSGRGIIKVDMASGSQKNISFSGEFNYRPSKEREYIFDHIWKQVADKFYDKDIHGIDWAMYRDAYSRFLPYINNNFDFQEMLSELLGELNGSHTGARYYASVSGNIGKLGFIPDYSYSGDGLKIAEVLAGGPLSIVDPEIKAGDVIEAIDGKAIKAGENWIPLLSMKAGDKVLVTVKKNGKKSEDIYVEAGYSDYTQLYRRWVRQREEMVEKLSGGRVGYVHVAGMDSDSFREVYSKLLGKFRTAEAVIVDTRHNGGGWLHDDLATLLDGKAYIRFEPRGQYIGTEPYSKWTKPSCVLIGEDNYSDASGFPYVYKTLGIGKLIGAPVPGTMTAVWWEQQIDPTIIFGIPQVGAIGVKEGRYLENMQVEPDILVYNDPASVLNGEDRQLEAAVKEMLKEIGAAE
ncbi:MAG: PD40 domain-containing protein [Bacteroidetes bacterium]|uniref:Tricorn protease homolog n=1 Tax=Candidatus Cryptobacteroides excrementipullorum TaxID=2840761 RepID=A0A9D9IVL5_9BACT|nr:PD40 domain-containing protein [Candidatus Cryptobacteroides excrementipullorum]